MWDLQEAVSFYKHRGAPEDQAALAAFLREAQKEHGGTIPAYLPAAAAEGFGIKESLLLALIRRIPSLRLGEGNCLELCAGPNCGKHTALAAAAERLQKERPGSFALKFVPCMRLCGKGPNIKWNGRVYHKADEALLRSLVIQSENG